MAPERTKRRFRILIKIIMIIGIVSLLLYWRFSHDSSPNKKVSLRDQTITNLVVAMSRSSCLGFKQANTFYVALPNSKASYSKRSTYLGGQDLNAVMKAMEDELAFGKEETVLSTKSVVFAEVSAPIVVENHVIDGEIDRARQRGEVELDSDIYRLLSDFSSPIVIQPSPQKLAEDEFHAEWLIVSNQRVVKFNIYYDGKKRGSNRKWQYRMTQLTDYRRE